MSKIDLMGRFEKITPTGGAVAFQYVYDAASNETERHRFNGPTDVGQFYVRDSLDRVAHRWVKRGTTPIAVEDYTFDRMSRLIGLTRRDGKQDLFGYYWDGDMMWAQYGVDTDMPEGPEADPDQDMPDTTDPWAGWSGNPEAEGPPPPPDQGEPPPPAVVEEPTVPMDRWVSYFLANAGNRTRVVDTGVNKLYTPNNLNQYTQAESLGVSNGGEHEVSSFQNVAYTYRNDERLIGVTGGGNNYFLAYDALGRCVKRTLNGVTIYYIYDGEKPIIEYNSSGALVGRNLYGKGIDEILHRAYGAQSYYFQQDRNGNVTHLTDISGAIVEQYRYDAFGAVTILAPNGTERAISAYNNRFMFTGREYAATFGFYEYRARAYNPTLGRFMSEDPKLFDGGDYNLFRYCHNDPLDLTDPMGLETGVQPQPGDHPLPSPAVAQNKQNEPARRSDGSVTPDAHQVDQRARQRADVQSAGVGVAGRMLGDPIDGFLKLRAQAQQFRNTPTGKLIDQAIESAAMVEGGGPAKAAAANAGKIANAVQSILKWMGKPGRVATNKSGDKIFMNADRTKKLQFHLNNPKPHDNPHMHIDQLKNNRWEHSDPIYPIDVEPH